MTLCEDCEKDRASLGSSRTVDFEKDVLVFSYGTLKRGFCNHFNVHKVGISYWQDAVTTEPHVMFLDSTNRHRPCLVPGEHSGPFSDVSSHVGGELYCVKKSLLGSLDAFERVPMHYMRMTIGVLGCSDKKRHNCEVYFTKLSVAQSKLLENGHFQTMDFYSLDVHLMSYCPRSGNVKGQIEITDSRCSLEAEDTSRGEDETRVEMEQMFGAM
uniref:Gamma-glutamylcyclotransferase family protein n=1 Tax=Lankesteria abbotti TaxID=340204 RepID=A0A7S2VTT7_9APIC|eukprot:CAMPEP_0113846784 /NCGR_PEP_ID=MMETSP0372-20130328/1501_1 /TAXON_ID=340204 /ORGANISM="Lankesteria abbotti" /LENGTH=212 /DNA_ID=CAMNT_0000815969 /DNA_START=14 /DNA_END=652 /DNA_ORIENTATION=+ /assembly_acc=CAM_ASM_000359